MQRNTLHQIVAVTVEPRPEHPALGADAGVVAAPPGQAAPSEAVDGVSAIARHFALKWQHHAVAEVVAAWEWASSTGAAPLAVSADDLSIAAARLRRPNVLDCAGVAWVSSWLLLKWARVSFRTAW